LTKFSTPPLIRLVAEFQRRRPIRATSLIITIFGDVVILYGGSLWLGSLVRLLEPLGIDERLVRTSVFRLVREGWLESERVGRRSYYQFSAYGQHEYERAAGQIYALEAPHWDGSWLIVVPMELREALREPLRRSMHWQGFRLLTPGVYAKPGSGRQAVLETLSDFALSESTLLLNGALDEHLGAPALAAWVHSAWQLDGLAREYRAFTSRFKPLALWLRDNPIDAADALYARLLLIHDLRRVLLQDTALPEVLLPRGWPGPRARNAAAQLYHALVEASLSHIHVSLEQATGPLPAPDLSFFRRFSQP
jgi:phenylacetic acid degradation operon negative regulatory protein